MIAERHTLFFSFFLEHADNVSLLMATPDTHRQMDRPADRTGQHPNEHEDKRIKRNAGRGTEQTGAQAQHSTAQHSTSTSLVVQVDFRRAHTASRQTTVMTHPEVILDHVSQRLGTFFTNWVIPYL